MYVHIYKYKHTLNESSTRSGKKSWEHIPGFSIFQHWHFSYFSCLLSFSAHIYTFFQSRGESYMQSERPLVQIKRNCRMKGNRNRVSRRTNSLHLLCHTLPSLFFTKFPDKFPLLVGTSQKCEHYHAAISHYCCVCLSHVQASRMQGTAASFTLLWLTPTCGGCKCSHMVISMFSKLHCEQFNLIKIIFIAICGKKWWKKISGWENKQFQRALRLFPHFSLKIIFVQWIFTFLNLAKEEHCFVKCSPG